MRALTAKEDSVSAVLSVLLASLRPVRQTAEGAFRVTIRIVAADTTGMANHITETVIRDLKLNIRSMNLASRGGLLTGTVDVEVPATSVVDTLVHAILRIKGVQKAFRTNG